MDCSLPSFSAHGVFSRQEYCSGLPFPSPVDLIPTQGSNPWLLCLLHCRQILYLLSQKIKFIILTILSLQFENEMNWNKVAQLCLTLCDPIDCSLPASSVHGIFQSRVMEWVAISFSRGSSWPRDQTQVICIAGRFFTSWIGDGVKQNLGVKACVLKHIAHLVDSVTLADGEQ